MFYPQLHISPGMPGQDWLVLAMVMVLGVLAALLSLILYFLLRRRRAERLRIRWADIYGRIIQRTIFHEDAGERDAMPVPVVVARSLGRPQLRQLMIAQLIGAKRAISGTAATNLVQLYRQLALDRDSLHKLASPKWHLQAQGIQELATMEQRDYLTRLYRLTNAQNEVVRREAQGAIVQLYGFDGLRFLDVIDTPLSEWQQIQLLRLLQHAIGTPEENIFRWLRSPNVTVRIFTLRLIAEQHLQQMIPHVTECLLDLSGPVRLQAIRSLGELAATDSVRSLTSAYQAEGLAGRLAILQTLGSIGVQGDLEFLDLQLSATDNRIKLEAARALARSGEEGLQRLDRYPQTNHSPWKEIFQQAKSEWVL